MGKPKGPGPQYVVVADLNGGQGRLPPPPHRHRAPRYHSHSSGSDGCCYCFGCLCCCCFLLVLIIAVLVATMVFLNPKPPSNSVTNLSVTSFNISSDLSLHTRLNITIRAENPNGKIGITYGNDSSVRLTYRDIDLCSGKLPSFYQRYHNVTVVTIVMDGQSKLGPGMQEALRADKQRGEIPVNVYVTVPVQLHILGTDMSWITVTVLCELVVDSIDPDKKIGIKWANYTVVW